MQTTISNVFMHQMLGEQDYKTWKLTTGNSVSWSFRRRKTVAFLAYKTTTQIEY